MGISLSIPTVLRFGPGPSVWVFVLGLALAAVAGLLLSWLDAGLAARSARHQPVATVPAEAGLPRAA
jgi:hypothetical protein